MHSLSYQLKNNTHVKYLIRLSSPATTTSVDVREKKRLWCTKTYMFIHFKKKVYAHMQKQTNKKHQVG